MKIWKWSWKWKIHHIDTTGLDTDKIIINIESVSVWWGLHVLSNTQVTFEAQFMKKLSKTKAKLKKHCL